MASDDPRTGGTMRQRVIEWKFDRASGGISVDELVALCSAEVVRELRMLSVQFETEEQAAICLRRADSLEKGGGDGD